MNLMSMATGLGLATGAGSKAFIPIVLLGLAHHTEYFELSERWLWLASPPVLAILGVLVFVEIAVDSHPALQEFAEPASYLPKFVAGFLVFAAMTGELDTSLAEFMASGLIGGTAATGTAWVRNLIRRPIRTAAGDLGLVNRGLSWGEAGSAVAISATSLVAPWLALAMLAGIVGTAVLISRKIDARRDACPACGGSIRPAAAVCAHCRAELLKT